MNGLDETFIVGKVLKETFQLKLIHQQVCADVNRQFQELKADIDDKW